MCDLGVVQINAHASPIGGAAAFDVCHHRCYNFLIATILLWLAVSIAVAVAIAIAITTGRIGVEGRKEIRTVVGCNAAGQLFLLLAATAYLKRSTHFLQSQQLVGAHAASYATPADAFSLFAQFLFTLATLLLLIAGALFHEVKHLFLYVYVCVCV